MRRLSPALCGFVLLFTACRPVGADIVTPTPVLAATSYVAPLSTVAPTTEATGIPTPQPEDLTPPPEIITVEPATEVTETPAAEP